MKVILDCRSVFPGMGGIGRATAAIARHLGPALEPSDELVLLLGARAPETSIAAGPNVTEVRVDAGMIDPRFEQVRLPGLIDELEADVYHGTCFSVPIVGAGAARVATIHDVVFRRHPELVAPALRSYLDRWTSVSCDVAEAIVTPSRFSRDELQALYRCPRDKVEVVSNAVEAPFFGVTRRSPRAAPFILYVGSIEPKKNVDVLIEAFARLLELEPGLPHRLAIVGGAGGAPLDLDDLLSHYPDARGRIHALGHVSDEALLDLYATADAFCYLSAYEGFGLPPLEAMAAGVPTIVSDRAALPEVVGDDAWTVDPDDPQQVTDALRALLRDGALRADYSRRGRERARGFDWGYSARRLVEIYRDAIARAERAAEDDAPSTPSFRVLPGGDA